MTTIHSVGHSRHTADQFIALLRAQEIALLVDVRSHPASKWAPQFGKAALAQALASHAIEYLFLGRELGGRPEGAGYYRFDGAVDYQRRARAPEARTEPSVADKRRPQPGPSRSPGTLRAPARAQGFHT